MYKNVSNLNLSLPTFNIRKISRLRILRSNFFFDDSLEARAISKELSPSTDSENSWMACMPKPLLFNNKSQKENLKNLENKSWSGMHLLDKKLL